MQHQVLAVSYKLLLIPKERQTTQPQSNFLNCNNCVYVAKQGCVYPAARAGLAASGQEPEHPDSSALQGISSQPNATPVRPPYQSTLQASW